MTERGAKMLRRGLKARPADELLHTATAHNDADVRRAARVALKASGQRVAPVFARRVRDFTPEPPKRRQTALVAFLNTLTQLTQWREARAR